MIMGSTAEITSAMTTRMTTAATAATIAGFMGTPPAHRPVRAVAGADRGLPGGGCPMGG
jgi:hypothetical protein